MTGFARRSRGVIFAVAAALVLTACAGADDEVAEPPATDETEEAPEEPTEDAAAAAAIGQACTDAADEPQLIWYSSQDPSRNDAAVAAFTEAYPDIEIEALRLATGALAARYAEERDSGLVNADIISLADPNFIDQGFEDGWFVSFEKSEFPALERLDDRWFDRGAATTSISLLGIAYNTDLVGDNPPESWEDLLDPAYEGELILGDPRNVPSFMSLARLWRDEIGEDFLRDLAAQNPVWVDSVVPPTQQLAAGEVPVVAPNVMTVVLPLKDEGAPIDFVSPELTTGNEFETMISEGADSPNAARCLYNFLFTEDGQIAYNGPTSVSPFGAIGESDPLPEDYIDPKISELPEHEAELTELLGLE